MTWEKLKIQYGQAPPLLVRETIVVIMAISSPVSWCSRWIFSFRMPQSSCSVSAFQLLIARKLPPVVVCRSFRQDHYRASQALFSRMSFFASSLPALRRAPSAKR
jgi:cytochrome c oxidase subunit IV